MKKISKLIISLVLAFFAIGGVGLLIFNRSDTGWKALTVTTGSMRPELSPGSMVFVHRVPESSLKVGDVITYINPKNTRQTITHRITAETLIDNQIRGFITKGDANPNPDQVIPAGSVIGKKAFSVPLLGSALGWTTTLLGLAVVIYLPALIVFISEIRRLAAYYRSQHYVLPEFLARHAPKRFGGLMLQRAAVVGTAGLLSLGLVLPVRAAQNNTASLTGNVISAADITEPEPPNGGDGSVIIRRTFVACEEGEDEASKVDIILYNSTMQSINMTGWSIQSGGQKLVTFPDETIMLARSLFDTEIPIVEGISYSQGSLSLHNAANEQIDDHTWSLPTSRDCRIEN